MKLPSFRALALLGLTALLGAGCATVPQRQYGRYMGDMTMRSDRDPAGLAMAEHMFFSREAATGGRGVGGGGCGCN